MIIYNLILRDYYKIIVKVNNEIVHSKCKQIEKDTVELMIEAKPLLGSSMQISLVNEIYESKTHTKSLYILGLIISTLGATEEGLLGNPLSHICEFTYDDEVELSYKDGLFIDRKTTKVSSWLACNEVNYRSWLCIMRVLTNIFCFVVSIVLLMISSRIEMFFLLFLIFLFLNMVLHLYSKRIKKFVI